MTKIKICGLKSIADINIVNKLLPEYVGFVFYPPSKRFLEHVQARILKDKLSSLIKCVGVFVNASMEEIIELVENKIIDVVQLHGDEDDAYIRELKLNLPENTEIIKAFLIKNESDIKKANNSIADYILLDNGLGTGEVFDWSLVSKINRKFFLAGGLSVDNVSKAIELVKPYCVDVSSKVETDGIKDEKKIQSFVDKVRSI